MSGVLLLVSRTTLLPAARLAQVPPHELDEEVERLSTLKGVTPIEKHIRDDGEEVDDITEKEKLLKAPVPGHEGVRWLFLAASVGIILVGWIMFGLGVNWGVHGSVIAGTTGE